MDFFQKANCDRCGKKLTVRTMSMFNSDTICLDCKKKEEAHPDYVRARQAEREAVRRGDGNYSGIGLPPDLR
ncbi:gamma-glutamylcyclotransferase [Paenibacillus antri]|uniref:Gamma-glutamylcyclotransferase n=1 Tax=Paenibacillus antri TaxID=2582848 RepID=A0A5R9G3G8_9BACL|nr:gamma-glutamylcyclotransferase [Paenibacillus antri]TLS48846.1 gamma-glutamylcyclotransferase [Paenibacillus antri]